MDCLQTQATLLFAYGEGSDDHATHIAGCVPCQRLLAEHEAVVTALAPLLPAVRPRRARLVPVMAAAVALAAAALLWIGAPDRLAAPEPMPQTLASAPLPLDAALDAIDLELTALEWELK